MADETVTVNDLALDVASSDVLSEVGETVEVNSGNTAVITNVQASDRLFFTAYENGGGAATLTVAAGDKPPAERQGLGTLVLTIPSGDFVVFVLEAARYMKSDDTIDIVVGGQNVFMSAQRIPKGA